VAPLLLALAIAGGATEHGRLVLGAGAVTGWANDPFVGAGLGGGPVLAVSPDARLDLSLSPRLKLAFGGDLSWLRFTGADFEALESRVRAEARLVVRRVDLSVELSAGHSEYSRAVAIAELSASSSITSTESVVLAPGARLRAGPVALRGAVELSTRWSEADDDVSERAFAPCAGLEWRVHRRLEAQVAARHERVASARPDFARVSTGGEAVLSAVAIEEGPLEVAWRGGRDRIRFDTGVAETLSHVTLEVTHPVGQVIGIVAWSWSRSEADGAAGASRNAVYAGLRARSRALSW
jgi:hypothetical protein